MILQQRRFAGAVDAEHADLGVGKERQPDVLQHLLAAGVGLGKLLHGVDVLRGGHEVSFFWGAVRCAGHGGGAGAIYSNAGVWGCM